MTTTAEERAKKLLRSMMAMKQVPDFKESVALVAAAISQAQNDKLEEAALRVEGIAIMEHEAGGPANDDLMSLCVNQIRSLKSKD